MAEFTWLDFLILGVFILNTLMGFARGLTRELVSIISVIVALGVSIRFTLPITEILNSSDGFKSVILAFSTFTNINAMGPLSLVSLGVSFLVLFVGTYSIGEAVNYSAATFGVIMFPAFALLDRLLAACVGFIRGYIFNMVLILIVGLTPFSQGDPWSQSYFIPRIKPSADKLANLIRPGGFPLWSSVSGGV